MSKRKTRQQKIIADLRRKLHSQQKSTVSLYTNDQKLENANQVYKLTTPSMTTGRIDTITYSYLRQDIIKTLFVTTVIIGLQIVLFLLLKNHILVLPVLTY